MTAIGIFLRILVLYLVTIIFIREVVSQNLRTSDENSFHSYKLRRRHLSQLDDRFLGFRFIEEPSDTVAVSGKAELKCRYSFATESPLSVYTEWLKDNTPISTLHPNTKLVVQQNRSAILEKASSGDEGIYQCKVIVSDIAGSWTYLSRKAYIRIPSLSRFEKQPQKRNVHIGQTAAFECVLTSYPPVKVQWLHNGKSLNEALDGSIVIHSETGTLEISNTQLHHQGLYKCIASNGIMSRESSEALLTILEIAPKEPDPFFVLEPRGSVVKAGNSLVLECLANGDPQPEVRWLKDSEIVAVDGKHVRLMGLSSLLIVNASLEDTGTYTCRASNLHNAADRSAEVQVNVAPVIVYPPKDVVAKETAEAEFNCVVSGTPGALVNWFKNGEAIIASEYFVVEGNRLRILGLVRSDQGVYQCTAENDAGFAQSSAQLIVESADNAIQLAGFDGLPKMPSEPLDLRTTSIGSRFVTLSWDRPLQSYGLIIVYRVYYKEFGSERERNINSTSTTCVVPSLQPNSSYLFRVVAVNEAGQGTSSRQITTNTSKEQAVPGKVRNLRARALGSETIDVSWEPPLRNFNGAEVRHYILFYTQANHVGSERETQVATDKTAYKLRGMAKFTEYNIRIEAEGSNGPGLSSEVVKVKTLSDAPSGSPTNVRAVALSRTAIQVMWTPVAEEEQNGVITGYRLRYKSKFRNNKAVPLVVDGNESSYIIDNLEPDVEYSVRVAAVNVNGTGPNSDAVKVKTLLQDKEEDHPPPAPSQLILKSSLSSITAAWLPPADPAVMVRKYKLGWGPGIPDLESVTLDVTARNYTVKNLSPNREYVFSLRAHNNHGAGFPIYETAVTSYEASSGSSTDADLASSLKTPVEVRVETMSANSILVSWTDLERDGPGERLYYVRCTTSSEQNDIERNFTVTKGLVEHLLPYTQYECSVRVGSEGFKSPWSMSAVNRTFPAAPSSAPCDITVIPSDTDPQTVILSWQPPKYANGDIDEYLIWYTHEPRLSDKEWRLGTVGGNEMTYTIMELIPHINYYFKVQARNVVGLGPLSQPKTYNPEAPAPRQFPVPSKKETLAPNGLLSNSLLMGFGIAVVLLILTLIIITVWYLRSRASKKRIPGGYIAGRKSTSDGKSPPDLWINHPRGQHSRGFPGESPSASSSDLKRVENNLSMVDAAPPPRYQTLQANGRPVNRRVSSSLAAYGSSSVVMTNSALNPCERRLVGVAEAMPAHPRNCNGDEDSNGTLTRSYHQSSSSLESRQRTPQVIYSGSNRYLPVAKIDFSDHGSSYGSSQGLHSQTPPPQLPHQGPPSGPPSQISEGYRTLRGTAVSNSNPLKSFTQLAGAPPPLSPSQSERIAHVVRPVVIASPCSRGKPAGIVIGQKCTQVPVGRATAQPRVNVNNIYAPYAVCSASEKASLQNDVNSRLESQPLQQSNSTEELNAQMENLDTMIDDLQAMQHEFSAAS